MPNYSLSHLPLTGDLSLSLPNLPPLSLSLSLGGGEDLRPGPPPPAPPVFFLPSTAILTSEW